MSLVIGDSKRAIVEYLSETQTEVCTLKSPTKKLIKATGIDVIMSDSVQRKNCSRRPGKRRQT